MPYALINVAVNRPIRRGPGSVAEVRRPAPQNLVQPVPHLLPGPRITGYEKVSHLFLDACHCLLRRAGPQIPTAILLVAMWPERVPEKAKALLARLLDAGLRLIQGDPHACDHLPRPIQCLGRFTATENHEIIRVVHDMGVKLLSPFGVPPTLQQTVHVHVGEQRAGHPPCGVPQWRSFPPVNRRFPFSSRSSTGAVSHILIRRSTSRSTIRWATHCRSSQCGMLSKYLDRSASTTSV